MNGERGWAWGKKPGVRVCMRVGRGPTDPLIPTDGLVVSVVDFGQTDPGEPTAGETRIAANTGGTRTGVREGASWRPWSILLVGQKGSEGSEPTLNRQDPRRSTRRPRIGRYIPSAISFFSLLFSRADSHCDRHIRWKDSTLNWPNPGYLIYRPWCSRTTSCRVATLEWLEVPLGVGSEVIAATPTCIPSPGCVFASVVLSLTKNKGMCDLEAPYRALGRERRKTKLLLESMYHPTRNQPRRG